MTKRERLLLVLKGKQVDRIPISPFIHENYVREFYKNRDVDLISKTVQLYDYFDFDVIHRNCNVWDAINGYGDEDKDWRIEKFTEEGDSESTETTVITTPEKQLKQIVKVKKVYKYESIQAKVESFIKDEDDFNQFLRYQPPVSNYDCSPIVKASVAVGDKGVIAPWVNGAFNSLTEMRKLEDIIMDAYINQKFYDNMINYFGKRSLEVMKQFKKAGADLLSYTGNIANATLVGLRFYNDFVFRYERDIIKEIQDENLHVLYHNCGDANSLINSYNCLGFSVYESLTPPPYGDTDIDYALQTFDRKITLMGNIDQIDLLRKGCREEIVASVRNLLEKVKSRGNFILGTSDYLNENTPVENIRIMGEAGLKYGSY